MNNNNFSMNKTAMLIDTSSIDNYINKKILCSSGFTNEVITYTSTTRALNYLKETTTTATVNKMPDYIFLNLDMQMVDGNKFSQEFDKLPDSAKRKTKLVFLSGSSNLSQSAELAKNKNVFALMSGPLIKSNIDELIELNNEFAFAA